MSLEGAGGRLSTLTVELMRNWERTRAAWRDSRGEAFGKHTIEAIRAGSSAAVDAMQRLNEMIRTIRRDCE